MTVQELRDKLHMTSGQLLTCASGLTADILGIKDDKVILVVLHTGKQIEVPINCLLPRSPAND